MDNRQDLTTILDDYKMNLEEIKVGLKKLYESNKIVLNSKICDDWEKILSTVVYSYMHMMNNRLGISILDESYLAYLNSRALLNI